MWGGYAEVVALSQHFGCTVYVIRLDDPGLSVDDEGMLIPSELYRIQGAPDESIQRNDAIRRKETLSGSSERIIQCVN